MLYNIMQLPVDSSSPVPLYHQVAEAIRYRIATGVLKAGDVLPPLRRAATEWGVNLHTVRHAYAELAVLGLVRTDGPRGSVVLANGVRDGDEVAQFLIGILQQAAERFGLNAEDVQRRLAHINSGALTGDELVCVVECSEAQSEDLAQQLQSRWRVRAEPWSLERPGEPAKGAVILSTYFHYNDIRSRWPHRFADVRFTTIRPDPSLGERLRARSSGRIVDVLLCEREESMARNIAADLAAVLPSTEFRVRTHVTDRPSDALEAAGRHQPVLFAPRVWGALSDADRGDPRALAVRYVFDAAELGRIGSEMNWGRQ